MRYVVLINLYLCITYYHFYILIYYRNLYRIDSGITCLYSDSTYFQIHDCYDGHTASQVRHKTIVTITFSTTSTSRRVRIMFGPRPLNMFNSPNPYSSSSILGYSLGFSMFRYLYKRLRVPKHCNPRFSVPVDEITEFDQL